VIAEIFHIERNKKAGLFPAVKVEADKAISDLNGKDDRNSPSAPRIGGHPDPLNRPGRAIRSVERRAGGKLKDRARVPEHGIALEVRLVDVIVVDQGGQ
jgi:hypothetical protein